MSRVCDICGKHKVVGGSITRRGLAKKKGGIGMHVVKNVKRTFVPNLQRVKAEVDGTVKHIKACTNCIRSGRVKKVARVKPAVVPATAKPTEQPAATPAAS
jgi:large subunit ribosomal protein L28